MQVDFRRAAPAEELADEAKALWDRKKPELLVKQIAAELTARKGKKIGRNVVASAIAYWHTSRGLPVPDGRSPSMIRREVNYVTRCRASLRHGMPVLDFASPEAARGAWDFRFFPLPEHVRRISKHVQVLVRPRGDILDPVANRREFGVLNRLSEAMTRFAFLATDANGRPLSPAWSRHRRTHLGKPSRPVPPEQWMPRPYLAFPSAMADRMYALATEAAATTAAVKCASCRRRCELEEFRDPRCGTEVFDDGDFVAHCPRCLRRRKWHLADVVPARVRRRFPLPLRERFCEAVARGIPLALPGPASYLGPVRRLREGEEVPTSDSGNRLDLVPHLFREHGTDRKQLVFLPRDARLHCGRGWELEAGDVFAHARPREVPARWRGLDAAGQWVRSRICVAAACWSSC